jgi:hypothetical protein
MAPLDNKRRIISMKAGWNVGQPPLQLHITGNYALLISATKLRYGRNLIAGTRLPDAIAITTMIDIALELGRS